MSNSDSPKYFISFHFPDSDFQEPIRKAIEIVFSINNNFPNNEHSKKLLSETIINIAASLSVIRDNKRKVSDFSEQEKYLNYFKDRLQVEFSKKMLLPKLDVFIIYSPYLEAIV